MSGTRVQRADDVVYEVTGGRAVLLDAAGTELITLNPVGTLVWQAIDGRRDAHGLAAAIQPQLGDVDPARVTSDVVAFVGELRQAGLVVDADG